MIVPVDWVPLVARVPLHAPEAAQEVALAELQASVELPPGAMTEGFKERVAVGGGMIDTVALLGSELPPGPVQTMV